MNDATPQATTHRFDPPGWSVERFAEFWSDPRAEDVPPLVTEDVVGWWPGADEPVRGVVPYSQALADLLKLLPDMRLTVAEHASNGDTVFVRWIMRATGRNGPFRFTGIDRITMRNGRVAENVIRFDSAHLKRLAGFD
ncbi:MAG: ester cyclase [Panacagrimonas sp.]|jgi:ketosteroid isomerase-like protein|nr:nuclear transport factor 2 family protein [Panacagrimonas sp.]MCC2658937.1 ester cyclase [Panacagrimonas sp.]